MKYIFIVVLLLTSLILSAQEPKTDKEIYKTYTSELNLDTNQSKQFIKILKKYKNKLRKNNIDNNTFNKQNKLRDLEVYEMLDHEQFEMYKKMKLKLEPAYKYRF